MNPSEETPITNVVVDWLIYIKGRFTERTQVHYRSVIGWFVESLPEEIVTIAQLHNKYIENYISTVISKYTNRTGNAHLTVLKSFHKWLARQYDLPNYGAKVGMLHEDPPKQRFLTHEEYMKVLKVIEPPVKNIIEFIANTGLRCSELRSLTWGCVNCERRMLTVIGKGRKRRFIPLNQNCMRILLKLKQPGNGPVFTTESFYRRRKLRLLDTNSPKQREAYRINLKHYCTHEQHTKMDLPLHRNFLYAICSKAAQAAGINVFGPHSLRHYLATELLKRGTPISHVSRLLGHSSIRTTEQIYIHWQPEFLNGITDCLVEDRESNP